MSKVRLFFLLLLCWTQSGLAQQINYPTATRGDFGAEFSAHYGFLIAHRDDVRHLQTGHLKGAEVSFLKHTNGSKAWHNSFLYPEYGFSYMYFDLANEEVLGNAHALIIFANFPLKSGDKTLFYTKAGLGPGWIANPFDSDDNFKDIAIGSSGNLVAQFKLGLDRKVLGKSWVNLNTSLTHFSNGSIKVPNLGINLATLNIGFKHYFGESITINTATHKEPEPYWFNRVGFGGGIKKVYPPDGELHPVHTLDFARMKNIRGKSLIGVGVDVFYNPALIDRLKNEDDSYESKTIDKFRSGVFGAYELQVSSLSILFDMGFYIHNSYKDDGFMYHRIGTRWALNEKFDLFWKLKTHFARADFMELGCEYKFGKK